MPTPYLLTGAGFTHNFGAPLSSQMWGFILNHVDGRVFPTLKNRMLGNFDFEDLYQKVMRESADVNEQAALTKAVTEAYGVLDEIVTDFNFVAGARRPINIYNVQHFISGFSTNDANPNFFFTLNQDLFIERHYYGNPDLMIPGVDHPPNCFTSNFRQPLGSSIGCRLPSEEQLSIRKKQIRDGFYYVKLHGSCNWVDASGSNKLVLGQGKADIVAQEPVLHWYFQLFQKALFSGDSRLMVVGYSFRDAHVNAIIAEAVKTYGLEVFLLTPNDPVAVRDALLHSQDGADIWGGITGYFQTTFGDLFPADETETPEWRAMQGRFFGRRIH